MRLPREPSPGTWPQPSPKARPASSSSAQAPGKRRRPRCSGVSVEAKRTIEINPVFREHLKREHPTLRVDRDRAAKFSERGIEDIKAVASGLPPLSTDQEIRRRIAGDAVENLRPGGPFIQFA
ncbi:MAG: hypothetical protein OXI01_16160 [Albidovulum sp.]|nr:hypothetical protein [Albidovulum sp.]